MEIQTDRQLDKSGETEREKEREKERTIEIKSEKRKSAKNWKEKEKGYLILFTATVSGKCKNGGVEDQSGNCTCTKDYGGDTCDYSRLQK